MLERYRQSVLAAAFRGNLTADWREEHPEAEPASSPLERIRAERRKQWEEAELARLTRNGKKPTDDTWKAKYERASDDAKPVWEELPPGWLWTTLNETVDRIGGGTAATAQSDPTPFPVLKSSAIRQRSVNLSDVSYLPSEDGVRSSAILREGDLVFTRLSGSLEYVANCARVSGLGTNTLLFPDRVFRAVPVPGVVPDWIVFAFSCASLRGEIEAAAKSTAGHQRISLSDLKKFVLPLPPLEEQRETVRRIEAAFAKIDAVAKVVDAQRSALDAYDHTLLTKAFRGELVPQNPTDEPAETTLARIRKEPPMTPSKGQRRPRAKAPVPQPVATPNTANKVAPPQWPEHARSLGPDGATVEELYRDSQLVPDDFYRELRAQVGAGQLREERRGDAVRIVAP